jgi:hypothetical protein
MPRLAMPREDGLGLRGGQQVKRLKGRVGVLRYGSADDLGTRSATGHVERHERIAAEDDRFAFKKQGAATGGVAGSVDHARRARYIEHLAIGQLLQGGDCRRTQDAFLEQVNHVDRVPGVPQVRQRRQRVDLLLPPEIRAVRRMRKDACPRRANALDASPVIRVVVRDQDRVDVRRRVPQSGDHGVEPAPVARQAGVEQGQPYPVFELVPVLVPRGQAVDARRELSVAWWPDDSLSLGLVWRGRFQDRPRQQPLKTA